MELNHKNLRNHLLKNYLKKVLDYGNELIKITVNKSTKELRISPSSNFVGRSLYICKNFSCIDTAFKKGRIYKILKIKPDETFKEKIRAVLEN